MAYKRDNGIWYSDFIVRGVRVNRSLRTTEEATAREREAALRVELRTDIETAEMLLSEAVDRMDMEAWAYTKTGEGAKSRMTTIIGIIGDLPVSGITQADINKVRSTLVRQGKSQTTTNRYMASFRAIMRRARDRWNITTTNPYFDTFRESGGRVRIVTHREEAYMVRWFAEQGRQDMADLVVVLIDTGMRLGELLAFRRSDYEDLQRTVQILPQNTKRGTGGRIIPLTERAAAILAHTEFGHLTLFNCARLWNKAKNALHIQDPEFVIHSLRHTAATRLIDAGVDLYEVQRILGHTDIKTTQRYARMTAGRLRGAIDRLSEYNRHNVS